MVNMVRFLGLFTIIPVALLLTVSFFVLVVMRKIEEQSLKTFAQVIAVLLWIGAALVFSMGVYIVYTGQHPMMVMMRQMMQQSMMGPSSMSGRMSAPMMRHQMMQQSMPKSP